MRPLRPQALRHSAGNLRFCAVPLKTFHNEGGLSEYRSLETERHDTLYLRKKFGEALNIKKNTAKAKVYHQYQRTLTIPF